MPWSVGDSSREPSAAPTKTAQRGKWWALLALGVVGAGVWIGKVRAERLRDKESDALKGAVPEAPLSAPRTDAVLREFVLRVADDVQATWQDDFARRGKTYARAELVVYEKRPPLGCAPNTTLFGSAHCPGENKAFIDLARYRDLDRRFGSAADAIQTYVIAHELGHHVQGLMGLDVKVQEALARRPVNTHWSNTQLELQADCFAGVWARQTPAQGLLEKEDFERVLKQTNEDGRARQSGAEDLGTLSENYTYAIPRRRLYWFVTGFAQAKLLDCDTFATD
jgi:predicted metalloprotease